MTHTLTAAQHRAMEGVAPFDLPEHVVISGRKVAGTRARVYGLLRKTAEEGISHRIGELIGPAGWVPNYYLRRAWSGGSAGDRRMRDLREKFGVEIESTRFSGDSSVVLFRWVSDPRNVPGGHLASEVSSGRPRENCPRALGDFSGNLPIRFHTSVGFPGDRASQRLLVISQEMHPLALSPRRFAHVVNGDLTAASALAGYSATLKARWPQLREWLAAGGDWVLWIPAEMAETLNPLPLLVEILTKCGAQYQGEWHDEPAEAGVA